VSADVLAERLCPSRDLPQPVSAAESARPSSPSPPADPCAGAEPAWTDEQRRAIERRHGDLLLDAAAGSGKTAVLVERFARAVLEDGVAVGAILTITFTEKAAAELRERIRARLLALGAPEAARATEGAFISTIHGFCARVLRTHALAAGLDPRFTVLDPTRSGPLAAAAFQDALDGLADGPGVVELIAAYGVGTLRAAILGVSGQLRSLGQREPRLPPIAAAVAAGADPGATLRTAAGALATELGAIPDPGATVVQALGRVELALELDEPGDVWPADLYRLALPRNGAALSTDACAAYSEALASFRAAAAALAAAPVRELLDALLQSFSARYAAAKEEVSGLDFEDLELLTRDLLAAQPALREHYAERFDSIMVDELQDTNRVQLTLIEAIARDNLFTVGDAQQSIYGFRHAEVELFRERGRRLERAGARETLRTNFRTAPEIIDVLNPAFAEAMGDEFTPLRAGRPPTERLGPEGSEPAPPVELLIVDKGADWDLEGMASPWRLAEARALAARMAELVTGGAAPGEIVVLMRAGTDMRVYERALEQRGLPTYVIGGRGYWAHPQVVDMVAYLRALANPREEEALYGVLASPLCGVSLDALVILSAAARAASADPWTALCRDRPGELEQLRRLGLDDADSARLRGFARWFAHERARAARAGIEELLDRALTITGYDLEMLAMPGGRRRLANVRKLMRLGREHETLHGADLRGFLDLLDERERGGDAVRDGEAPVEGEGLDAIRMMTIHRAKGLEFPIVCVADLGRSPRPPSAILRVSGDDPGGSGDGRLGLRLARAGAGGRESALEYSALGNELRAAEEREERRLFYVAMTRARERLLLSGAAKFEGWLEGNPRRVGGGPIAWIAPAFVAELSSVVAEGGGVVQRGAGRLLVALERPEGWERSPGAGIPVAESAETPVVDLAETPVGESSATPAGDPVPGPDADIDERWAPGPPVATLSYSTLGEYERCGYRFYAERVLGLPPAPEPPRAGPRAGGAGASERAGADANAQRGRRRGVLVHALLERLDFRRPVGPGPELARVAAARAGLTPPPGPEELDGLAAVVRSFAGSQLCARLGRASEVRREQRFAFALDDDHSRPMFVGVLDVLAREPAAGPGRGERLIVVDYKTDRLAGSRPADAVARGYAVQQLVYALAALHAGAAEVEVIHCFLELPDAPVVARFARADLSRLGDRLRSLAAGVVQRRFEVAPDPHRRLCAGCPAEGGLCSWPRELTRRESAETLF
jgi:ATP-dependent helicase/nuclease subunit A